MAQPDDPGIVAIDMLMVAAIVGQPYDNVVGYIVVAELDEGQGVVATNYCCTRHAEALVLDLIDSSGPACTSPQASLN